MLILPLFLALATAPQESITITEVVAVSSVGVRSRSALNTDTVESRLALGTWTFPEDGEAITSTSGKERTWSRKTADENGSFSGSEFRGGWAAAKVDIPRSSPWRCDVRGLSWFLVDGEPHAGDVYGLGITRVPLYLEEGQHEFLFRTGRGSMRASLEPAPATTYFEERDRTLPDVIRGEDEVLWVGQIVGHAGAKPAHGLRMRAVSKDGSVLCERPAPSFLPSSLLKVSIPLSLRSLPEGDSVEVRLELLKQDETVLHETEFTLRIVDANEKHVRTFVSEIDGSVQYYGVTPPRQPLEEGQSPALFLSLHGASVEGRRQAFSYAPKDWGVVVAPTNRRPYGFDWEDWGRMDALEVLELASARFNADPQRTYLTGHSMGGHGTWQVGAHFPDKFAAIAPSAGWRDFWNYGGAVEVDESDPVAALMLRSSNVSRTLLLKENYLHGGIYILHGDADDNVPVREARAMRKELAEYHPNFAYYERPGAGHWWGDQCMDWPPLFEFLRDNVSPQATEIRDVQFTTVNPAISNSCYWVSIDAQLESLAPSHLRARIDGEVVRVETSNVLRATLDLSGFVDLEPRCSSLEVDGQTIPLAPEEASVTLQRTEETWTLTDSVSPELKGPHRSGPFKDAFRNRMVFVYGTQGTDEENAWALAKARYDHETWRYRGNGAVDVIADEDFLAKTRFIIDQNEYTDRGIVLYGNQDTNAAWNHVLSSEVLELRRDRVRIGDRTLEGEDLALLAVRPRKGSDKACVAIVGGTGLVGCRVTDHRSYFVSGVGYPDWTILGVDSLTKGVEGIRAAGFFGVDWSTEANAEAAWRSSE